jgi:hypothetical protein
MDGPCLVLSLAGFHCLSQFPRLITINELPNVFVSTELTNVFVHNDIGYHSTELTKFVKIM